MDMSFGSSYAIHGVRIIESIHATAEPTAKPRTDDMVAMIEHLRQLGLVRRLPAAFQTPAGLVVHPDVMAKLRKRLADDMDTMAMRAMMGGR